MAESTGPQKETVGDKVKACGTFFYNGEEGTVMGRGAKSWGQIGIFYLIYYACLAGFFAAALAIFYQIVDDKVPNLYGADSLLKANPSLGFRPMPKLTTTVIRFDERAKTYQPYIDHLDSFLKPYDSQTAGACPGDNSPRDPAMYDQACEFRRSELVDCASGTYGYTDGKPCILIKLNRVYDWQPEPYSDTLNDTAAIPPEIRNIYKDYSVTVKCYGENPADEDNIGPVEYFPKGGFPYKYFPYMNQEGYVSPLVMVKLLNPKVQTLLMIECRAYAKNIRYDRMELDGAVHFELIVDFPPNSTTPATGK